MTASSPIAGTTSQIADATSDLRGTARRRLARKTSAGMVWLLSVQYATGLVQAVNVTFPPPSRSGSFGVAGETVRILTWTLGHGGTVLAVHALLGLLITATALVLCWHSLSESRMIRAVSIAGLVCILSAAIDGLVFLNSGGAGGSEPMGGFFFAAGAADIALFRLYAAPDQSSVPREI